MQAHARGKLFKPFTPSNGTNNIPHDVSVSSSSYSHGKTDIECVKIESI